ALDDDALAFWLQHCERVVPFVGREHMAPHRNRPAIRIQRQRDSTTLATMIGELVIAMPRCALVVRVRVVDGGAGVLPPGCLCLAEIPLVDPCDPQTPRSIHQHRLEAMRDELAITMHDGGRGPALAAIERAR